MLQLVKSYPFIYLKHEKVPLSGEPPYIDHYGECPPPPPLEHTVLLHDK